MNFKKYGIGITTEKNFKTKNGVNPNRTKCFLNSKLKNLFQRQHASLRTERKLFEFERDNILFYKNIKCYRGLRHLKHYPVRGQRTHTNATRKIKIVPRFR